MEIQYKDIILRDYKESDIEDDIRWSTTETEWVLWDAPWESKQLESFDPEAFRKAATAYLDKPKENPRWGFDIDTGQGVHIGGVNAYMIDEDYRWVKRKDLTPDKKVFVTMGIDIKESSYWGKGFGTMAMEAFILYHLEYGYREICLQTWSGNLRMIKLATTLGFKECGRVRGKYMVDGKPYDGLTFLLDVDRFRNRIEVSVQGQ